MPPTSPRSLVDTLERAASEKSPIFFWQAEPYWSTCWLLVMSIFWAKESTIACSSGVSLTCCSGAGASAGSGCFSSAGASTGSRVRVGTAGASRSKLNVLSAMGDSFLSNKTMHSQTKALLCTTSQSASQTRPGCGSQRLLRCRLHPAGRGPNGDSLFPPLAAVVAVAPCRGASGKEGNFPICQGLPSIGEVASRSDDGEVWPQLSPCPLSIFCNTVRSAERSMLSAAYSASSWFSNAVAMEAALCSTSDRMAAAFSPRTP